MPHHDVLVLGAGPAALALARSLGGRDLSVRVLAPDPRGRWTQNFGAWADELTACGVDRSAVEATWASPLIHTRSTPERLLDRRYARIDTPKLQVSMLGDVDAAGVELLAGRAVGVEHEADHTIVKLADGTTTTARVVVDATGGGSRLLERRAGGTAGYQVAYGQLVEVDGHPWDMGEMVLMDFRAAGEGGHRGTPAAQREESHPSFLYAMPLGRDLVFVEETVLVSKPAADVREMATRLSRRLERMGIHRRRVLEEEQVCIRMGGPLPRAGQRLLGFGSSAGLVHPATGYSLTRSLRHAPELADAIVAGLDEGGGPVASLRGWEALWPRGRARTNELYQFGMDVLCRLDIDRTGRFFDAFFDLPDEHWSGFLSASLPPSGVARAMAGLFVRADLDLQRLLIGTSASPSGSALLRSVVGA